MGQGSLRQKCKGEPWMRRIWERGDNRAGMHWEGGLRCVLGPLVLWAVILQA